MLKIRLKYSSCCILLRYIEKQNYTRDINWTQKFWPWFRSDKIRSHILYQSPRFLDANLQFEKLKSTKKGGISTNWKLPTLTLRGIFNDLVYTFKILNRKLSVDLSTIFVLADVSRLRGHSKKLFHEKI